VDHVTVWRWVQRYGPILNPRLRRDLRHPNRSWRVDETYVRVAGTWTYLYLSEDSAGQTIDFMLSPKPHAAAAGSHTRHLKEAFRLAVRICHVISSSLSAR
jgi:IS6 family transposase